MSALRPLAWLLGCQLAGELGTRWLGIPVPGPVIGCALLLGLLLVTGRMPEGLKGVAEGLLRYLPVMFVPAGVGVMTDVERLREEWAPLIAVLVLSTVLTIAASAWIFGVVARLVRPPEGIDDGAR